MGKKYIEAGKHLLRCLVYVDLNRVRAGVVDHPSQWPHGGYHEIQKPRRKNIIIACERLRELAGFKDYASFTAAHRNWVRVALTDSDVKRENKWTESIAVGRGPFIERIKTAMGAMATGRSVKPGQGAFELRETQSAYSSVFRLENADQKTRRISAVTAKRGSFLDSGARKGAFSGGVIGTQCRQ